MKYYLAQMKWCEHEEPICVGTNKKTLLKHAVAKMKQEHGNGPVDRGMAGCSLPITYDDIEISEIEMLNARATPQDGKEQKAAIAKEGSVVLLSDGWKYVAQKDHPLPDRKSVV